MSVAITPPNRVSKIIHRERKAVAVMITDKLKETNWENTRSLEHLYSWLNGVATPETSKEVKDQILNLRQLVREIKESL